MGEKICFLRPFLYFISLFYFSIFLIIFLLLFPKSKNPQLLNQNITIYKNISVLQDQFSPSIVSFFLHRKPINFYAKKKVFYIKDSIHYRMADVAFASPVLYTMKNTIASTENVFIYNNSFYIFDHSCHDRFINYTKTHNKIDEFVVRYESFDSIIAVGHQFSTDFGHWLLEILPMIVAIPSSIKNKSKLLLPKKSFFVTSALEFFNYNLSNVIYGENTFVYGNNVYTMYAANCGRLNQWLLCNFRAIVIEKLNLDTNIASKYVLYNRKKGYSRRIANFNELLYLVQLKYPNTKFEKGIYFDTFDKQVIYFNQIKLIFAVHGSLMANIVFMQENTVVVEMQMEVIKDSFFYCAMLTGKYLIVCRDETISYRKTNPNKINIERALEAISKGLELL